MAEKASANGRRMAENSQAQALEAIQMGRNMGKKSFRQALNMAQQAHNQDLEKARMVAQSQGLQFGMEQSMDNMGRPLIQGPNGGMYVNTLGGGRNYRPNMGGGGGFF